MLGDAINRLIKFSLKSLKEKISYAHLMCGEYGLVHALINIFSFGYELYLQSMFTGYYISGVSGSSLLDCSAATCACGTSS